MSNQKNGESQKANEIPNKKKGKSKVVFRVLAGILFLILCFCALWTVGPKSFKNGILKEVSTWPFVRQMIMNVFGEDLKGIQDEDFNEDNIQINEEVYEKLDLTGYTNIALFGVDSRDTQFDNQIHSDTQIILSINNDTDEIRMVSVYRDTMLRSGSEESGYHYDKCNAAYFREGVEGAINMINTNLDLNITDYGIINFAGLANIVDEMGGVTVTLTDKELDLINNTYLPNLEKITKTKAESVAHAGRVKLQGMQAVAYCRIRYTTYYAEDGKEYHDDLGRTARQRAVIMKLVNKAKRLPIGELMTLAKKLLNMNTPEITYFRTSMSADEILNLIPTFIDYEISDTVGFPFTLDYKVINGADMVIPAGLSYNVKLLHLFLFDDREYEPSSTVQDISYTVRERSGIPEYWLTTEEEDALSPSYVPPETEAETGSESGSETESQTE